MPKVWLNTKNCGPASSGFSIVEVLLAATIFAFLVTAVVGAIVYGRASNADAGEHNRAMMLAEEGLEECASLRYVFAGGGHPIQWLRQNPFLLACLGGSLALFLTAFVMGPAFQRSYDVGIRPQLAH